jgi:type IV pilus assembly protein PilB
MANENESTTSDSPPIETALDGVSLFRSLSPMTRAVVEKQLERRTIGPNTILFEKGEQGKAMYVIVRGRVSVFATDEGLGLTYEIAKIGPNEAFGEMSLLSGKPRSASVRTIEETELLVLPKAAFFQLCRASPDVGLAMAQAIATRLAETSAGARIEFVTLRGRDFSRELLDLIPMPLIRRHRMVPIQIEEGVVTLATPNPHNRLGLDDLKRVLRSSQIRLVACSESEYTEFAALHLSARNISTSAAERTTRQRYSDAHKRIKYRSKGSPGRDDDGNLRKAASGADVANLLSSILLEGIEREASDIYIEPERRGLIVRYRIEGGLVYREGIIPGQLHLPLISRIKVLASLDITERRLPQDGRISVEIGNNKTFDLRLATVNTNYGEKCTLRILDSARLQESLSSIIHATKVANVVRDLFFAPSGMILVTGPTGSGKTTTLYAALLERATPELSICTAEDPVEYDLAGISQVQVNENIGLGFAPIMRTFMRQAPDIILIGETRDGPTARLACNAALTGHLVLTSFHTQDSISAIPRLLGMDVEPFVLATALQGIVNQRLLRRLCPECRRPTQYTEMVLENLAAVGVRLPAGVPVYKAEGCASCGHDGYLGRIAAFEILGVGPSLRESIARRDNLMDMQRAAAKGTYLPLANYCTWLITQGLTVPTEVLRTLSRIED